MDRLQTRLGRIFSDPDQGKTSDVMPLSTGHIHAAGGAELSVSAEISFFFFFLRMYYGVGVSTLIPF